jgi:hypothetical protein
MGVTVSNFKSKAPPLPPGHVKISNFFTASSSSVARNTDSGGPERLLEKVEEDEDLAWLNNTDEQKECDTRNSVSNRLDRSEHAELAEEVVATRGDLECPVCSNTRFSSLDDLNTHIDICLNTTFLMAENIQNS